MDIAAHVFATWTQRGARAAQLADRFLDGSIDQLAHFLTAATTQEPQQRAADVAEHSVGDAAAAAAHEAGQLGDGPQRSSSTGQSPNAHSTASNVQHVTQCDDCRQHRVDAGAVQSGASARPVDVRHALELSYDEFVWRYMAANVPIVIRVSTAAAAGHTASDIRWWLGELCT